MNKIFFGVAFILLLQSLQAQTVRMEAPAIESLRSHVKEVADNTRTLISDFIQVKEMKMLKENLVSKGKFYFKKEKSLRWEYLTPYSYIIVIHDDRIAIRDEEKVNRFDLKSNKVFLEINRVILGSIRGTLLYDEVNFKPTFYQNRDVYRVDLQTLNPKLRESLPGIIISFNKSDYSVTRVEMMEAGNDRTVITFSNKKTNQPVGDEKFDIR
ncbi:MAG: outer membrane lipoprotein carrier protein LolA [Alphaproteobacteria bacterium]|nr:outer membrane lipoprotein carrier protein LolA [Alphaproteobacteria bacterium]